MRSFVAGTFLRLLQGYACNSRPKVRPNPNP